MGYYKYIIVAFLLAGLLLVGVYFYQDYTFNKGLETAQTPIGTEFAEDEEAIQQELDMGIVRVANTKETSYGLFRSASSDTVVLDVGGVETNFTFENESLILLCTDQQLYDIEKLDTNQITNTLTIDYGEVGSRINVGDPVVVMSLRESEENDNYFAYALIVRGNLCN